MFQQFTGLEYLKIDIANNFGLDKVCWDDRIIWFNENELGITNRLDDYLKEAEEPALFYAGVQAYHQAKEGKPSGYPISLDATCSGIQILAALAGDRKAASLCNVVDTGAREDAYTGVYREMVARIGDGAKISRKETKKAIMTAFYGSKAQPKNVFGEGELLRVFYDTMKDLAPGAWEINETMLAIWDPTKDLYEWSLPDNFHVRIPVKGKVRETVHFLNEPFDVTYEVQMPIQNGRSLGANMVHSIDGMIVREMQRRCNFNHEKITGLVNAIEMGYHRGKRVNEPDDNMVLILWGHYLRTGFLSARILDHLCPENMGLVDKEHILNFIATLPKKPFEILSIHDCFRCLPNYGNDLRRQYNFLLAEIARSSLLSNLVSQMLGREITVTKHDESLPLDIIQTNYALS